MTRRAALGAVAGLTLAAGPALAQEEEIVIGASLPLTGVFAFAGVAIESGLNDYITLLNEEGGIDGKPVRLVYEDTGYKVEQSLAVFNKITSSEDVHFYYGDSTGFAKTIGPEIERSGDMVLAGASFATELNDPEIHPHAFITGPDYSEMVEILLEYIAEESPGATVAMINSDTEFGRDPIERTKAKAEELGLDIVLEIVTAPGAVDVSTEVLKLRRSRPDYAIFHGYVLAPLPEFITQAKELGLETQFMGTFWSMDSKQWADVGEAADGYMGVMPYRYYHDTAEDAPMLDKIREMRGVYQHSGYMQGFLSAMLMTEATKRVMASGEELTGDTLKAALNSIQDFDTGGIIGVPISIPGNSVPVGRVYRFDAAAGEMMPVSDWITLGD
ncbi:MAG: ABC transporter substrate-binding protein [Marinibacterium profundimaris]